MTRTGRNTSWKNEQLVAVVIGLVIFLLVYAYSGDADLLEAVLGGAVGALLTYATIWLRSRKDV